MPPYKILVLDTGNEWGGGTNSLIELLKRVDRSRYQFAALFYRNYPKGDSSDIKAEIEKLGMKFILLESPRPRLKNFLKELARPFLFRKKLREDVFSLIDFNFRVVPNAGKIARIIRANSIDLLYMNNQPASNLEGILAAKECGIKALQHARIDTALGAREIRAVNGSVSRVICVSRGVMDGLAGQGVDKNKLSVVYNGIDSKLNSPRSRDEVRAQIGVSDDEVLIGSVGTLTGRKMFADLVESVDRLAVLGLPVKGIVVGEGPDRGALEDKIAKGGLGGRLSLPGFSQDVPSYLKAFDIFVLPSKREGLPRVILEAMLMGLPVVACNVAGPFEQVVHGDTGYLYKNGDVGELAGYLHKLVSSPALRQEMGGAGRQRVMKKFSIEAYVKGVAAVFEEVLG